MKKTLLFLLPITILLLWILGIVCDIKFLKEDNLNTLFTGFGVIGLIITLYFQQKQISENKEDANAQVKNLNIQNFENRFFQLINNYQKSISLIYFNDNKNMFRTFFNNFKSCINKGHRENELIETFDKFRTNYPHLIEYSFINQISFLINIIEENSLIDKSIYYNNLNCLLSDLEKKCLFIIINYDTTFCKETKELFKTKFEFLNFDAENVLKNTDNFFTF